jgi:hypothetical protein
VLHLIMVTLDLNSDVVHLVMHTLKNPMYQVGSPSGRRRRLQSATRVTGDLSWDDPKRAILNCAN